MQMGAFAIPSSSSGINHGVNSLTLDPSGDAAGNTACLPALLDPMPLPELHKAARDPSAGDTVLRQQINSIILICRHNPGIATKKACMTDTKLSADVSQTGVCTCAGTRLLVSSHKSVHFLYDAQRPHLPALAEYRCHSAASFYVRAAFSPDGSHFITGSSESNAYIWEVRPSSQNPPDGIIAPCSGAPKTGN